MMTFLLSATWQRCAIALALPFAFVLQSPELGTDADLSLRPAAAAATLHAQWRPRVRIFVGPEPGYVAPHYASPPRAAIDYLHYAGDPIAVDLTVGNTGADDVHLDFGPPPGQLFSVHLEGESSTGKRLHPAIVGTPVLGPDRSEKKVRPSGTFVLPAQRRLALTVALRGAEELPPGDRVLVVSLARNCRPDCELTTGRYAFEVRAATSDGDRNEWLQRRVYVEMARRKYPAAQEQLRQLTERAPDRVITWITASRLAAARGRWCEAAAASQRGISIAEAKTDAAFRGDVWDLRNTLAEAQKRCK